MSFLVNLKNFCPFLIGLSLFSPKNSLNILDTTPLSGVWFSDIFSKSAGFLSICKFFRPCCMAYGIWDLSSSTRGQTRAPCIGSLNHWTTREVPSFQFLKRVFWNAKVFIADKMQFSSFPVYRLCFWCHVTFSKLGIGGNSFNLIKNIHKILTGNIILWRREWQPTPIFLPGESHEQRSLVGYNPMGFQRVRHDWATNTTTTLPWILFWFVLFAVDSFDFGERFLSM